MANPRNEEIKSKVRDQINRAAVCCNMRQAMDDQNKFRTRLDSEFFGFVTEGKTPEAGQTEAELRGNILKSVPNIQMSKEMAQALGLGNAYAEKTESVLFIDTFERESTRSSLCFTYALTQGMTVEQIFSDSPEAKAQKERLGRQFIEIITPIGEKQFKEKMGNDANYKEYFEIYQKNLLETFADMNQTLGNQPFDFFKNSDPKQLAADYRKADMLIAASQDLVQACPKHIKNLDITRMQEIEDVTKGIGGLSNIIEFCEKYLATDLYAKTDAEVIDKKTIISRTLCGKAALEIVKTQCEGFTRLNELSNAFTCDERERLAVIKTEAYSKMFNDDDLYDKCQEYMQTDKESVLYIDEKSGYYQVADPKVAMAHRIAQDKELSGPDGFEEITMEDIKTARVNWKDALKEEKSREKEALKERKAQENAAKKAAKEQEKEAKKLEKEQKKAAKHK